jgi:hypothetical protein
MKRKGANDRYFSDEYAHRHIAEHNPQVTNGHKIVQTIPNFNSVLIGKLAN